MNKKILYKIINRYLIIDESNSKRLVFDKNSVLCSINANCIQCIQMRLYIWACNEIGICYLFNWMIVVWFIHGITFACNHFKIQFIGGRMLREWKCLGTNTLVTRYKMEIDKSFWEEGGLCPIFYKLNQTCFFLSQYKESNSSNQENNF